MGGASKPLAARNQPSKQARDAVNCFREEKKRKEKSL
jgi:hypothetical protein